MRKSVKTLGITAALAVMIPFSAYAATTSGSVSPSEAATAAPVDKGHRGFGAGMFGRVAVGEEVLELLKLDKDAYREKAMSGLTLGEIADQQGVSRDSLKSALTEGYNRQMEERKQQFAAGLDTLIDAKPHTGGDFDHKGGKIGAGDLTAIAETLGLTADELKAQLKRAGRSRTWPEIKA